MRHLAAIASLLLIVAGCAQPRPDMAEGAAALFAPTAMRIHPIFTQVRDWTGDGNVDGVEVLLEFQDRFGDPTKAAGTVLFELFEYRPANPDPRGARLANPFVGSIVSVEEQRLRWNRTSRTYTFQLALPAISPRRDYVLTAAFRAADGGRFFDRVVLKGQEPASEPATQPVNQSPAGLP
jgi:hypothetical protein